MKLPPILLREFSEHGMFLQMAVVGLELPNRAREPFHRGRQGRVPWRPCARREFDAALEAANLQNLLERRWAVESPEDPGHLERKAVDRTMDGSRQVVGDLPQLPFPDPLIALLAEAFDVRKDLVEVQVVEAASLQGVGLVTRDQEKNCRQLDEKFEKSKEPGRERGAVAR